MKIYGDLPGFRASENPIATIPAETLPASARPDVVITYPGTNIAMLELTIPFDQTPYGQRKSVRQSELSAVAK